MTLYCAIQWIDENGKPTPDSNPAVAIAVFVSHQCLVNGRRHQGEERRFPICAEHVKRIPTLKESCGFAHWRLEDIRPCQACEENPQ